MRPVPKAGAYLFLIGFTSIVAQVVLMRELMVVFLGNEISLGVMLACWLLWTAFGAAVSGRAAQLRRRELSAAFVVAAAGFPAAILIARESKRWFQTASGEVLGLGPMLLTSCAALAVFCVASGWLFSAGSRLFAAGAARSTSSAYLWEAAGAATGGLAASLLLVSHLDPFVIAGMVAWLNLLAAVAVLEWPFAQQATAALISAAILIPGGRQLERVTLERFWRPFQVVTARNTPFGSLTVLEAEGSRSLTENGSFIATVPDSTAAEETVHLALLEHPAPRTALLIGGGANGSLAEALKHPGLERLVYAELDPAIPDLAKTALAGAVPSDARLSIRTLDGRLYVKRTPDRFDVVIVGLPGPQTAQLNRFYTVEFFREAAQHLNPGGVLCLNFPASENYISADLALLLQSIQLTMRAAFPHVAALPGSTIHVMASASPLTTDAATLVQRLRDRGVGTRYIGPNFLPFRITPERVRDLARRIEPAAGTPVNRDMAPVAYYFNMALWNSRFSSVQADVFRWLGSVRFDAVLAIAAAIAVILAARKRRSPAALCIGTMGFTIMGIEVLLLLGFQAMHGYVYQQLAILIAGFMTGLTLGSWATLHSPAPERWLAIIQGGAVLTPLVVCNLLPMGPAAIALAAIVSGLLGGAQFPAASAAYFAGPHGNRGALYAIDLAGSCLGALLFSAYLIPVFGFFRTAVLMSAVNAPPALAAALGRRTPAR